MPADKFLIHHSLLMKHLFFLLILAVSVKLSAQDSIRVLQYNILNYGNYTSYCTNSNNNHIAKEGYLRTIIGHLKPDILTVNELGKLNFYHDRLLSEVMNADGRNYYKRSSATNYAGSDIINMLFFDSTKLTLHSADVIQSYIRDINLFKLFYKTSQLVEGDTIFLNCIVAHLKAGDSGNDEDDRAEMASNVIDWLTNNAKPGNYLLMGDFNLYSASEEAYQSFTSITSDEFQFFDPVNAPGDWSNNISFSKYHTQSVSSGGSGCKAGGGMDDRFDFILATDQLIEGSQKVRYKQGSYKAVGQDGNHFNVSITADPNYSVPENVLEAIGNMSDHLPVTMVLEVESDIQWTNPAENFFKGLRLSLKSPDEAVIYLTSTLNTSITISIYSLAGQLISQSKSGILKGFNSIDFSIGNLKAGYYLINLETKEGHRSALKLVK